MTILWIVQILYKTKLAGYINWHDDDEDEEDDDEEDDDDEEEKDDDDDEYIDIGSTGN